MMILIINWINTTGEYILGSIVKEHATAMIAAGTAAGLSEGQIIGDFYAKYFSLANAARPPPSAVRGLTHHQAPGGRLCRDDPAGPLVRRLQHPVFVPLLNAALAAKVVENSIDYSLNNTVRNMLFLPCTYEQKFAAKQAIDSFFVRMGDVLSAALVFAGTAPHGTALARLRGGECSCSPSSQLILAWRVGRYYKTHGACRAPCRAARPRRRRFRSTAPQEERLREDDAHSGTRGDHRRDRHLAVGGRRGGPGPDPPPIKWLPP